MLVSVENRLGEHLGTIGSSEFIEILKKEIARKEKINNSFLTYIKSNFRNSDWYWTWYELRYFMKTGLRSKVRMFYKEHLRKFIQ